MDKYYESLYNKSENTKKIYIYAVNLFIKYFQNGDLKVICESDIQCYVNWLKKKKSASTINLMFAAIKNYLEFKKVKLDMSKVSLPRVISSMSPKIISKERMAVIDLKVKNKQYRVIFLMLKNLGMRRSEIFNLRHIDIDIIQLKIEIKNSKGNKGRILPLTSEIFSAILKFKKVNRGYDRYFDISNLELINQYFKRIDPEISPHMFRHTFITRLIHDKKIDLVTVQAITGHSTMETLRVYYRPTLEDLRLCLN